MTNEEKDKLLIIMLWITFLVYIVVLDIHFKHTEERFKKIESQLKLTNKSEIESLK